jgi:hypothetical protein
MTRTDHFSYRQKVINKIFRPFLSDVAYANSELERWFGGGNVNNPTTFNEKLMWLKCKFRPPLLTSLVDKWAVRAFVAEHIGEVYLNECYGVHDSPQSINIDLLPEQFVIKATHGSGMNLLVPNKTDVDWATASESLSKWLKTDYSKKGREWVYRDVPRQLIVERWLSDGADPPKDYKVFCFNGEPFCIQVDIDRFKHHTRAYFDFQWNRLPFSVLYPEFKGPVPQPPRLGQMLDLSRRLSAGLPFVRVDWYLVPTPIFGELTFFPENGMGQFDPPEWDEMLGRRLSLPAER